MSKYIPPHLREGYMQKKYNSTVLQNESMQNINQKKIKFPTDLDNATDSTKDYEIPTKINTPLPVLTISPKSILKRKVSDVSMEDLFLPASPTFKVHEISKIFKEFLLQSGVDTLSDTEDTKKDD